MSATIRLIEKHYTVRELSSLIGFNDRYWRDRIKAEPQLRDATGAVVAQCTEISGVLFAPASWVNGVLARTPVQYDPGIKARNRSDLERKLRKLPSVVAAA